MQVQANIPSFSTPTQPVNPVQRPKEANSQGNGVEQASSTLREEQQAGSNPSEASIKDATKRLQDFVSSVRNDIQFSTDDSSGQTVVKVIDKSTQEVLRQIPSKEALEIAQALDRFKGLLVKQQA